MAVSWRTAFRAGRHQTLIDHLVSEYPVETIGRGRTVDVWKVRPNAENDLWDCLVGCAVAASMSGIGATGQDAAPAKRGRIRLSEVLQRKMRERT